MPSKADLYDGIIVGVGLILMIASSKMVPEGALQTFLIVLGFVLVLGDAILIEFIFEWITMHYPYVRIELQPSGKVLHVFLEKRPESTNITKIFKSTKLIGHWVSEHPYYGKFKDVIIHHELDFMKRVVFGPGFAVFQGYGISHPQTARIICHEYPTSSDRYKDLSIPAFFLAYAHGGDVNLVPLPLTSTMLAVKENPYITSEMNPTSMDTLLSGMKHYEGMNFAYLEANRVAQFYRSEKLRLEHGEASKDSQTKALLAAGADSRDQAWEIVLDWFEIFGAFDTIVKKMKSRKDMLLNKWTAFVIIAAIFAVTVGFFSMNKEAMEGLGTSLGMLSTQVMIAVVLLSVVGILWFITQRRKK